MSGECDGTFITDIIVAQIDRQKRANPLSNSDRSISAEIVVLQVEMREAPSLERQDTGLSDAVVAQIKVDKPTKVPGDFDSTIITDPAAIQVEGSETSQALATAAAPWSPTLQ